MSYKTIEKLAASIRADRWRVNRITSEPVCGEWGTESFKREGEEEVRRSGKRQGSSYRMSNGHSNWSKEVRKQRAET